MTEGNKSGTQNKGKGNQVNEIAKQNLEQTLDGGGLREGSGVERSGVRYGKKLVLNFPFPFILFFGCQSRLILKASYLVIGRK